MQAMNTKKYDLEDRMAKFAMNCRNFIMKIQRNVVNIEYSKQLARSSGSQAANYIEANECLGKKDFIMRIKICRKEAKESRLWLNLCVLNEDDKLEESRSALIQELIEFLKIFGAILEKSK